MRRLLRPFLAAFAIGSLGILPAAQEAELPAADPVLGAPLVINGKAVPFSKVRRQVCLGAFGQQLIQAKKLEIFIEEELDRRVAAGESREDYEVTEEHLKDVYKEVDAFVEREYPEGNVKPEDLIRKDDTGKSVLIITERFKRLFLPENPDEYPPTTLAALDADESGPQILTQMKWAWESSQSDEPENPAMEQGRKIFQQMLLQRVTDYLNETAQIIDDHDLLPEDVLMRVNGKDIKVAEIWPDVKEATAPSDVRTAKQWLTNMILLKEDFQKKGAWLSDEEAEAAYIEHAEPYQGSIFSIERLAVAIKRFPSVRAYKQYYRCYESFKRAVADQMTEEALAAHSKARTEHLVGQVSVDVDIILVSAYDYQKKEWKENGWANARERLTEVLRQLTQEERPWEQVLDEYSEFYDAPVPVSQRNPGERPLWLTDKGRFRNKQRNLLMRGLEESDYWMFLNGVSITDSIFFDQEVGTVGNPQRGPRGWYLPYLIRRSDPPARVSTEPEKMEVLVEQDYLTSNLWRYTRDLVRNAEVYGIEEL